MVEARKESSVSLKSSKHMAWRTVIMTDWNELWQAPAEVREDRQLISAAVACSRGAALQHASAELKGDKPLVLEAVALNGESLMYAAANLRGDREFVLEAIE